MQAGDSCGGKRSDGTPIVITVADGNVNCTGAVALLNEWLRRAPNEGAGSGGFLELYAWVCGGATATEAPKIGTCQRTRSGGGEFTAYTAENAKGSGRPGKSRINLNLRIHRARRYRDTVRCKASGRLRSTRGRPRITLRGDLVFSPAIPSRRTGAALAICRARSTRMATLPPILEPASQPSRQPVPCPRPLARD
jgi:hypothetical protein